MKYLSVAETAKKWNMSERSVRNYCALGKINGAFLTGKTWNIPEDVPPPDPVLLASELEFWYHEYIRLWEQTSRRDTLERTRRCIDSLADELRER